MCALGFFRPNHVNFIWTPGEYGQSLDKLLVCVCVCFNFGLDYDSFGQLEFHGNEVEVAQKNSFHWSTRITESKNK